MVCKMCGKPLSDPVSIQAGMGPICRGKAAAEEKFEEENFQMEIPLKILADGRIGLARPRKGVIR